MPRDQETSRRTNRPGSDDPLFREPADQYRDDTASGDTPIGDGLTGGRHATAPDDDTLPADTVSDTPGEWVAGRKGPGFTPAGDAASTDDVDTRPATVPADTDTDTVDPSVAADPSATGATSTASDLRTTRDPQVAPDSALDADPAAPGTEATRADTGFPPADSIGTAGTTDATLPEAPATTPPDATPPDAATPGGTAAPAGTPATSAPDGATTTQPGTPVPGAPGTAETAGVDAAIATFVTNGDQLHAEWTRIQSSFVDDPRGSVSQAADLVQQVTQSLVAAVQEREQSLRGTWDGQNSADTEHLRTAFRDYRAFFEVLVKL